MVFDNWRMLDSMASIIALNPPYTSLLTPGSRPQRLFLKDFAYSDNIRDSVSLGVIAVTSFPLRRHFIRGDIQGFLCSSFLTILIPTYPHFCIW